MFLKQKCMKVKLSIAFLTAFLVLYLGSSGVVQASSFYWKDDFKYNNFQGLQDAGWTIQRAAGVRFDSDGAILDGTGGDVSIHYSNRFPSGIYNWQIETKSMWLGKGHSVLSVFMATEKHVYGWAVDGYYNEFSFYRDSKKIMHFGVYEEKANQWITLTMRREGNQFSLYYNGQLENTYNEEDTTMSQATGVDVVSPWRGDAKYDYIMVGGPAALALSTAPASSNGGFHLNPAIIGGGIAVVLLGGAAIYYFVFAGSTAGVGAAIPPGNASGTAGAGTPVTPDSAGENSGSVDNNPLKIRYKIDLWIRRSSQVGR